MRHFRNCVFCAHFRMKSELSHHLTNLIIHISFVVVADPTFNSMKNDRQVTTLIIYCMPYLDKSIHIHRLFFFIVVCERFHICDFFSKMLFLCIHTRHWLPVYLHYIFFSSNWCFFSLFLFNGFPFQNREISRCLHVDCVWQKFSRFSH